MLEDVRSAAPLTERARNMEPGFHARFLLYIQEMEIRRLDQSASQKCVSVSAAQRCFPA